VAISPIGGQEPVQVELIDHVEDEPGQMISSQPVAQVRWQEKRLVTGEGRKLWPWLILRDCSA
jgi:hypothetical protein